jgi:signal transduction histidine kinase
VAGKALWAKIGHEIRTPLSAIVAYAEVLTGEHFGPLANPRYKSYARDIHETARHALRVADGMLQGERQQPEQQLLAFSDLDPAHVIESCLAVARPLADRAGLELRAEMARPLPRIIADELSLKQMLLNLLANAIKFARCGDSVILGVHHDLDGMVRISVTDTGPGMPRGALVMDGRAADAEATPSRAGGHGLGLPLTKALAAANGAGLAIDTAPGRGTCVTISFAKDRVIPV